MIFLIFILIIGYALLLMGQVKNSNRLTAIEEILIGMGKMEGEDDAE